jgi:RNA polymerase sigma-70 factor (ECF subfamily)
VTCSLGVYLGLSIGSSSDGRSDAGAVPFRFASRLRPRDDARDRARVEELFRQHERGLGTFLVQIIASRPLAEDLLQETFLAALAARARLDAVRDPRAWLYGIARNQALGALRRSRRERAAYERLARQHDASAPDPAAALAVRDLLERHLSAEDRTLLVLRYLHGFSAEELAQMSGRSPEALRQRLSRARRALVKATDEPGDQGGPLTAPLGAGSQ